MQYGYFILYGYKMPVGTHMITEAQFLAENLRAIRARNFRDH
jgi:hypothetical protein